MLPAIAAVFRAIDAALGVRSEGVADGRDIDEVVILGVDEHGAAIARLLEPHMRPRLAGIGGFINAFADDDVASQSVRAGAHVNNVRVRVGNPDRADRARGEVTIGDGMPMDPVILGLPDAAADRPHVEGGRMRTMPSDGRDTSAAGWTHHPVLEA